jgi:hypothetical protein
MSDHRDKAGAVKLVLDENGLLMPADNPPPDLSLPPLWTRIKTALALCGGGSQPRTRKGK